jgi:hypothetical protein
MRKNLTSPGSLPDISYIARNMRGEAHGNEALVPGPGHSSKDRSLSIKVDASAPDGFLVHSFAGDDPIRCKDYVREKLSLAPWSGSAQERGYQKHEQVIPAIDRDHAKRQLEKARWLWKRRRPLEGSLGEVYLRARGYGGTLPATLGFLPPLKSEHQPAMIAAFALADEPEPGVLSIYDDQVCGVHLTLLRPDGSGKAGTSRDKIMVGPSNGWPIVIAPMNDLLGLIICEGIETGLSLYEATGCGVWAAGSAGRMPVLADRVPSYVDCITIAGEADAGRKGATALAERLQARGLYCELRFLGDEKALAT